jgi:hypothetical protein
MSERSQRTAAGMRQKMLQRYGNTFHHKHDKNHLYYRQHCRSHPIEFNLFDAHLEQLIHHPTGEIGELRLKKFINKSKMGVH